LLRLKKNKDNNSPSGAYQLGLAKGFGKIKNDWIMSSDGEFIKEEILDKGDNAEEEGIWLETPPSVHDFFTNWFKEPLYPIQEELVTALTGVNPLIWSTDYDMAMAFWGKGSGKDRTVAKLFVYVVVKLLHMRNPQQSLDKILGGGVVGIDSAIDIINVSKDREQAQNVFFKNLKSIVAKVKNPKTGKNYFMEQGVDIREGKDVQLSSITFPHNITCYSLNSKRYAGEGLNIFYAAGDEIGASPVVQVRAQLKSIRETIDSRFPKIGKLALMSFKYDENCAMTIEFKKGLNDKRVFLSNYKTWEVNPKKSKQQFIRHYKEDPRKAIWTYECRDAKGLGFGFIAQKFIIPWNFKTENENPIVGNIHTTENILNARLKDYFYTNLQGHMCTIHIDLAKGKTYKGGDCAGLCIAHPIMIMPHIHPKSLELLKTMGVITDKDNGALKDSVERRGVYIDLMLRLVAPVGGEIQFEDIVTFIEGLISKGIQIFKVTYDGYSSVGEIQRLMNKGILAEEQSVDRTVTPYDTLKTLMYLGLVHGYYSPVIWRELYDLEKNKNGKVDHPAISWKRQEQEGMDGGSKDVSDAVAGATFTVMSDMPMDVGICW